MKKLICLILLGVMFAASYPTVPHEFESRQIIPASWLNENFNAANNAITDGTKKINVNEVEINGKTFIDNSGRFYYDKITATTVDTITLIADDIIVYNAVAEFVDSDYISSQRISVNNLIVNNIEYGYITSYNASVASINTLYTTNIYPVFNTATINAINSSSQVSITAPSLYMNTSIFGEYDTSPTLDAVYTATANGFVMFTINTSNVNGDMIGFVNNMYLPYIRNSYNNGYSSAFVFLVSTGQTWKVTSTFRDGQLTFVRIF